MELAESYRGKKVLITGGLGFLGSNLAHDLVKLGADVVILDALLPLYGGNEYNVKDIRDKLSVEIGDVRDKATVDRLIKGCDFVFHLAAQVSYIDSISDPWLDMDLNCAGLLNVLEACREYAPEAKIIFASSRMVLGKLEYNPVDTKHPTQPLSLYGTHKLTCEKYCAVYHRTYGLPTVVLRISNPYGPRQQMKHSKYCILGWFMRQAMEGKEITIFGEGKQIRDYVYVSDLVGLFLRAGVSEQAVGGVFNAGSGVGSQFIDAVETVVKIVGKGKIKHVPWPADYENIETGGFVADMSQEKKILEWDQGVELTDGLQRMFDYYDSRSEHYWEST
jgi:UDP-glucose 4-epimerase